jgi:hypothetical protein
MMQSGGRVSNLLSEGFTARTYARTRLRFATSTKRGSGISYPNSGVQLMLKNTHTQEYSLHYIYRYENDKLEVRFEDGQVDTIELHTNHTNIDEIYLFPESGTWLLEQIHVEHEYNDTCHLNSWNIHQRVGTNKQPALVLSDAQSKIDYIHVNGDTWYDEIHQYNQLKVTLLKTDLFLIGCGTISYLSIMDLEGLCAFWLGGFVGLLYLLLLEKHTDFLGIDTKFAYVGITLTSTPIRLGLISYITIQYLQSNNPLIVPYIIGFFMYKIAVYLFILRDLNTNFHK